MLLFKKVFFDAIRAGTKTTTLRYWRRRMVRPDSFHRVRGLGLLHVRDVRAIDPASLTEADARADGFDDLGQLRSALDDYCPPDRRADRQLYQLRFTFLPEGDGGNETSGESSRSGR